MMTTKQAGMRLFVIIALFFSMSLLAQAPAQTQPKPAPSPKEEALNRMRALKDDPPAYIDAITKFVVDFPYAFESESAGYWLRNAVPKPGTDPQKVRALVNRFIQGIEPAPAALQVRYDSTLVQILLSNNLWAEAVELAKKGIALLDEKQYVDLERKKYEVAEAFRKERYPDSKSRPFSIPQQVDRFVLTQTGFYVSLGRGYVGLNKLDDAEAAFRKAYEIKPGMESAWGLADVYERRGKDADALEYMTYAALTGRLKAKDIQHFHDVYKKLHQGKLEGVEENLDARYRKTYHNPVKGQKYQATSKRTDRVALAEFFTGGGCVPCIPFDYSFEAALSDYSRKDLILLVYHWHAPYTDPLCNHGNDARVKYYGINGAPTVLVDGKKYSGKDDANSREEAESVAQQVYGGLVSAINPRLETPAQGRLKLKAQRAGETIKVTVAADEIKNTSPDVTLHLALVENEVTYSGENGLRFQPMVVRNLAKAAGSDVYGFKMDISKANTVEYVFDLKGIMAENLRYYDEYPIERKKELSARLDKATLDTLEFSFREQKYIIDPNNISVVAFLEDNKTKEVLQASYVRVPSDRTAAPKAPEQSPASRGVFAQGIFTALGKLHDAQNFGEAAPMLAQYIKEHPDEASGLTASYNVGAGLGGQIHKNRETPEKVQAALNTIEAAYSAAAPAAHAQFSYQVARQLFNANVLLEYAAELDSRAIDLLTERSYVDIAKIDEDYMRKARAAAGLDAPSRPFDDAKRLALYPTDRTRMISLLGEINMKLGKTGAASEAFNRALKVRPTMEAYRGLSHIAEARGDKALAFDLLCNAFLTGKLPAKDIEAIYKSYALIKGSNPQALETYLDELYRKNFYRPVKTTHYQPSGQRSKKVVLAELFTGAACVPCIPSDLSIEAGLERYSRDELAVLVYHDNAPAADPLSNGAVQERAKYYATGGSTPHLFLDGKELHVGEEETLPEVAFASFAKKVEELLMKPEGAQLRVAAVRDGSKVRVTVTGDAPKTGESHLQIALVETELSYSGENGLRFQPMVVRASAKQTRTDSGFPLTAPDKINVEYLFDVDAVVAANFAYYDEYNEELKARTEGRFTANYREKKHAINSAHLAVVAFVQDDASKAVLQSAYAAASSR